MEIVTLQIRTTDDHIADFQQLAERFGATLQVTPLKSDALANVIEQAEQDFAEGRGIQLTPDQLRAMLHGA